MTSDSKNQIEELLKSSFSEDLRVIVFDALRHVRNVFTCFVPSDELLTVAAGHLFG